MNLVLLVVSMLAGEIGSVDPPALDKSGMPFLAQVPDGSLYLSWIDSGPSKGHALRFSRWTGKSWTPAETIATGRNWFINASDFPSIAVEPGGAVYAHWLVRPEGAKQWGYGIQVARRDPKTLRWRETVALSVDNKEDYAGFLSFIARGSLTGAAYLSPSPAAPARKKGESEIKTLRFVTFKPDGSTANDRELDSDCCTCCQTAAVATSRGLVVAYRDHLPGEIRDISVVRFNNGGWTTPKVLHADNWVINACPSDGPAITAIGDDVAIVWLTRAGGVSKVQLALSPDGGETFGDPIRIDDGNPLGRAAIARLDDRTVLVSWVEKTASASEIRLRRVSLDGHAFPAVMVASVPTSRRLTGFPKIAVTGDQILIAWQLDRVRVNLLPKQQFISQ